MQGRGRSTSVLVIGIAIFLLLAFAIYIFRSFPYLLGLVLIAEWLVLAGVVLGPLLVNRMTGGWLGGVAIGVLAVALANLYMLLLARRWGVEPTGWYRVGLHWQDGVVSLALALFGFVVAFLDALLKVLFNLNRDPIAGFLAELRWPSSLDIELPRSGFAWAPDLRVQDLRLELLGNLALGAVASLMTASVVKGLLRRPRAGERAAARH